MKICILNMPTENTREYFLLLKKGLSFHNRFADVNITLISEYLSSLTKGIDLFSQIDGLGMNTIPALPSNPKILEEYAKDADFIFVMCNTMDNDPDGYTFDILNRLSKINHKAYVIAECMLDDERARLMNEGADALIRPTRTYPSIFLRAMTSKQSEDVLEKMISTGSIYTLSHEFSTKPSKTIKWGDILENLKNSEKLPMGYIDHDSEIHLNPHFDSMCYLKEIIFY